MYCVVYVTVPDYETAQKISQILLEKKLCACVNTVSNVFSMFRWQDKIESEDEALMVIKTRKNLFNDLCAQVKELHPYEVPEIIALPIIDVDNDYANWLQTELG